MQLQDIQFSGKRLIQSYGDNGFRLTDGRFEGSILILPRGIEHFAAESPADFDIAQFGGVFDARDELEIMLLGTGQRQQFPSLEIRKKFLENNIALEVMDSGAACRTYNILVSEDRRIAAAIIAI
jgi:uncharacterized protein